MDGEAGWWTTIGNIRLPPLARVMGVGRQQHDIHKAPEPENVSELQYFIGLLYYYNTFISNLSTVMAPLYELLRKDTPWKWGKEQSKAFTQCKTLLHCDSLLVLACDASTKGVGCVLSHLIDGVECPIAFYSRTLKPVEKNYCLGQRRSCSFCDMKKLKIV